MTRFVSDVDLDGNQIVNLAEPTADQHAATRAYVLSQIQAAEGYTDENARDAIAAALVAGGNIDVTVDDINDTITISVESLSSADISDFDTAAVAAANAGVIDADTLGGSTKAQVVSEAVAAGYNDEAARDAIAAALVAGNNIDVTVDDGANTITIAVETLTSADISDFDTAAVAAANAGVIDADTLGGSTKAQVVSEAIAGVVDTAPSTLDTLNELAAALGDDPNFATTVNTALAARTQKYSATIGDGSATSIAVTHSLNSRDVVVNVYDATTYADVICDIVRNTVNQVTLSFATAPASNEFRVVVVG